MIPLSDIGISINMPDGYTLVSHEAMNTQFSTYLWGDDSKQLRLIAYDLFRMLDRIEDSLSLYRESSDVTRVNMAAEGQTFHVNDYCYDCLLKALQVSAMTGGYYHPFVGAESLQAKGQMKALNWLNLDGAPAFDPQKPVISLYQDSSQITKLAEGAILDLGGIGKGFALNAMRESLREWDIRQACLVAGGSTIYFLDKPDDTDQWELKLNLGPESQTHYIPTNMAMSCSGGQFQEMHIFNPRTQEYNSVSRKLYSFHSDAAISDGLSTGLLLMSREELEVFFSQEAETSALQYDGEKKPPVYMAGSLLA